MDLALSLVVRDSYNSVTVIEGGGGGYLTFVFCRWIVYLPAIHGKLLFVQEGKQGLPEDLTGLALAFGHKRTKENVRLYG